MRRFIIASHGNYAMGIKEALTLIAGENESVDFVSAYVDNKQSGDTIREVKDIISTNPTCEYLIMTDLLGGSVNTELMELIKRPNIHLVAGINLLFLLSVITASEDEDMVQLITRSISDAREGIAYCNDLVSTVGDDF